MYMYKIVCTPLCWLYSVFKGDIGLNWNVICQTLNNRVTNRQYWFNTGWNVDCFRSFGMLAVRWWHWTSKLQIWPCSWTRESLSITATVGRSYFFRFSFLVWFKQKKCGPWVAFYLFIHLLNCLYLCCSKCTLRCTHTLYIYIFPRFLHLVTCIAAAILHNETFFLKTSSCIVLVY